MLFDGAHIFGNDHDIPGNVKKNKLEISLKTENAGIAGFLTLILKMVSQDTKERPPASAILKHQYFGPRKPHYSLLQLLAMRPNNLRKTHWQLNARKFLKVMLLCNITAYPRSPLVGFDFSAQLCKHTQKEVDANATLIMVNAFWSFCALSGIYQVTMEI